jgi:hypothetical protein
MYRSQLEEIAAPIQDRAVELYAVAKQKAVDYKVINPWTKLTNESLNKLRPSQYPLQKDAKGVYEDKLAPAGSLDMMDKIIPAPYQQQPQAQVPSAVQPPQPQAAPPVAPQTQQPQQTAPATQEAGQGKIDEND